MITSQYLNGFQNIVHGFSTREDGDFQKVDNISLAKLNISKKKLVLPEQTHGIKIYNVEKTTMGKSLEGVDGLVTKYKDIALSVKTADCIPILFFDSINNTIGIAHSGLYGTLNNICKQTIIAMMKMGATKEKMFCVMGPHIRKCCYTIDAEKKNFLEKKIKDANIYFSENKHLDLEKINLHQLIDIGIDQKNIDIIPLCTSCEADLFFSYRREKGQTGRMLNFICLKT